MSIVPLKGGRRARHVQCVVFSDRPVDAFWRFQLFPSKNSATFRIHRFESGGHLAFRHFLRVRPIRTLRRIIDPESKVKSADAANSHAENDKTRNSGSFGRFSFFFVIGYRQFSGNWRIADVADFWGTRARLGNSGNFWESLRTLGNDFWRFSGSRGVMNFEGWKFAENGGGKVGFPGFRRCLNWRCCSLTWKNR